MYFAIVAAEGLVKAEPHKLTSTISQFSKAYYYRLTTISDFHLFYHKNFVPVKKGAGKNEN